MVAAYVDAQVYAMASPQEIEEWWTALESMATNGSMPISRRIMGQNAEGKWKPLDRLDGAPAVRLYLAVTWPTGVDSTPIAPPV
jgi:hypothetical protein